MSSELTIRVNGEPEGVAAGTTVAGLVEGRGLAPEQVAVELNQELVPRPERAARELREGDRVELVTLVGGG